MAAVNSDKFFWLIAAPKTKEDTFNTLNKKTADEQPLSSNHKFSVPDLKVGTLDSLMTLSDDLAKIDMTVEQTTRKMAQQLFDVVEDANEKYELSVNNNNIDTYLTFFRWDEAKYSTASPLKQLVEVIASQVSRMDEELRSKASEYQSINSQLAMDGRKQGGNWLTKDLGEVVKKQHLLESEFMSVVFVAVSQLQAKEWLTSYEKLTDFGVVPRSSETIVEDNDYQINRVVVLKKMEEDFKTACRDKKFIVREYSAEKQAKEAKVDRKKLEADKEKIRKLLIRWCKSSFSEVFIAWIHIKAIRVFVESVLRFGLPTNFQAMLLQPQKNKVSKLRTALSQLYGGLASKKLFEVGKGEEQENAASGDEKFFPYVFFEINLDFKKNLN